MIVPTVLAALAFQLVGAVPNDFHARNLVERETLTNSTSIPSTAQVISPLSFANLPNVAPTSVENYTTSFIPPNSTLASLKAKPFHVYDPSFLKIIGSNPKLTVVAENDSYSFAHEAVVISPEHDRVFFVANGGGALSYSGANVSNVVHYISISQAQAIANGTRTELADVNLAPITPGLEMGNGGTNYNGQILYTSQGRNEFPAALTLFNPEAPFNATVIVNNFFGRQFNALNDVAVHPTNGLIYFTDVDYGYAQAFKPYPGLPNQAYKFNPNTGLVTVIADQFSMPNGICFNANGTQAYITDTGVFSKTNDPLRPSSIYKYDVDSNGNFYNRRTFAFVDMGIPDGVHLDSNDNVWAGCGDSVHVYLPNGVLSGKIFTGTNSANFQFHNNSIFITGETKFFLATIGIEGDDFIYDL